jgi:arylsulfatase A-like enzyme
MNDGNRTEQLASKRLSRRELLKTTVAAAAAAGLAACGKEDEGAPEGTTNKAATSMSVGASVRAHPEATAQSAIIVVLDSLRADHVGCYGNDWIRTPSLDALAQESIVFNHAFPECLPTMPMRRCLHTGQRIWPFQPLQLRKGVPTIWAGWEPLTEDDVTMSETLLEEGYQTGFVTDTLHYFAPTMNFHRGFNQFLWVRGQEHDFYRSNLPVTNEEILEVFNPEVPDTLEGLRFFQSTNVRAYLANQAGRKGTEDYQAPRLFREAMTWLEENQSAAQFFLLVDSFDPHEPWDPPQKYIDLYDPDYEGREMIAPIYGPCDYMTEAELKHMRARYAGEVTLVDEWLGLFLERARDLGMLDRSLLIVTADHGHQLGEHGLTGKMPQGLWYELMDVPLIVRRPDGVGAGTRVDSFAQHQDIMSTVLNALGVAPVVPLPGINLLDLAADRIPPRDHVSSGLNTYSWYRNERYAYITSHDGRDQQLFDMIADPLQQNNLAAGERGVVEDLHKKLLADAGGSFSI